MFFTLLSWCCPHGHSIGANPSSGANPQTHTPLPRPAAVVAAAVLEGVKEARGKPGTASCQIACKFTFTSDNSRFSLHSRITVITDLNKKLLLLITKSQLKQMSVKLSVTTVTRRHDRRMSCGEREESGFQFSCINTIIAMLKQRTYPPVSLTYVCRQTR